MRRLISPFLSVLVFTLPAFATPAESLDPDTVRDAVMTRLKLVEEFELISAIATLNGVRVWLDPADSARYFRYTRDALLDLKSPQSQKLFNYHWDEIVKTSTLIPKDEVRPPPTTLILKGTQQAMFSFTEQLAPLWKEMSPEIGFMTKGLDEHLSVSEPVRVSILDQLETLTLTYSPLWSTAIELTQLNDPKFMDLVHRRETFSPELFSELAATMLQSPYHFYPRPNDGLNAVERFNAAALLIMNHIRYRLEPSPAMIKHLQHLATVPLATDDFLTLNDLQGAEIGLFRRYSKQLKVLVDAAPRLNPGFAWVVDQVANFETFLKNLRDQKVATEQTDREVTAYRKKLSESLRLDCNKALVAGSQTVPLSISPN